MFCLHIKFHCQWMSWFSGLLYRVVWWLETEVSEDRAASIGSRLTAIKPKTKYRWHADAILLLYILPKHYLDKTYMIFEDLLPYIISVLWINWRYYCFHLTNSCVSYVDITECRNLQITPFGCHPAAKYSYKFRENCSNGQKWKGHTVTQTIWWSHKPTAFPCKQVKYVKLDMKETGFECVDWNKVAQESVQWSDFVNTAMNLRIP